VYQNHSTPARTFSVSAKQREYSTNKTTVILQTPREIRETWGVEKGSLGDGINTGIAVCKKILLLANPQDRATIYYCTPPKHHCMSSSKTPLSNDNAESSTHRTLQHFEHCHLSLPSVETTVAVVTRLFGITTHTIQTWGYMRSISSMRLQSSLQTKPSDSSDRAFFGDSSPMSLKDQPCKMEIKAFPPRAGPHTNHDSRRRSMGISFTEAPKVEGSPKGTHPS
jgi:hypothetical protein